MVIMYTGGELEPIKMNDNAKYPLDELLFYTPKNLPDAKLYLVIKDQLGKFDAIELRMANSTKANYYNYCVGINSPVKIMSGACYISVLAVDSNTMDVSTTAPLRINIVKESYNYKAMATINDRMGSQLKDIYEDMLSVYNRFEELTRLNIEMLGEKGGTA